MQRFISPISRRDVFVLALLTAILLTIIHPMTRHMIDDRLFDYRLVINHIDTDYYLMRPNPLYYRMTLALVYLPFNLTVAEATYLLTITFYILTGIVLYVFFIRPNSSNPLTAMFWTITLMLVSAITLPTWGRPRLYLGYIVPTVYHNPTMVVLKPLILLLFWCVIRFFGDIHRRNYALIIAAALLSVLTTTNKPTYTIALIPALVLLMLMRWVKKQHIPLFALLFGIIIPSTFVLAIQSEYVDGSSNQIIIAPLEFLQFVRAYEGLPLTILQLILSIAYPAAVYLSYRSDAAKHLSLNLAWLVFIVGAGYAYLLNETGYRSHGNFFWSAQAGLFMLFAISTAFLLKQLRDSQPSPTRIDYRRVICLTLFTLHLICGIVWYLAELATHTPVWW